MHLGRQGNVTYPGGHVPAARVGGQSNAGLVAACSSEQIFGNIIQQTSVPGLVIAIFTRLTRGWALSFNTVLTCITGAA
jgi:hypothetical protein